MINSKLCALSLLALLFAVACVQTNAEQNHDILVNHTAIQLKLFNDPIHRFGLGGESFNYRVSVLYTKTKTKSRDNVLVSRLIQNDSAFKPQTESGLKYNPDEFVTFYSNVTNVTDTAFVLEIVDSKREVIASGYVQPFESDETSGYRNISLIDRQFNVVGVATISYLVVRPIAIFNPMSEKYSYTDDIHFMGHRGTGVGRRDDLPERYLENTIAAFNFAASKGAPMIELDVQLTAERIPIIIHDFDAKTFIVNRYDHNKNITVRVPVKDFSYKQLQILSTSYVPKHLKNDPTANQPFETLQNVLKQLNPKCGINVEIKYPQERKNHIYESEPGVELNEYVDRILHVLYEHSADRKIIITSFHPDLCTMIQLKQNRYRIGFLTSGNATIWNPKASQYYDLRTQSFENALEFAHSHHMKGISLEVQDILHEPKHVQYIKSRNLTLLLWGAKLNNYEQFEMMRKQGVDALIFDRFDTVMANHTIN